MQPVTRRRFIDAALAQEVIRAVRAKLVITANTAPKKAEHAASANDEQSHTGILGGAVRVTRSGR
jgi:hypothetical protein